MALMQGMPLSMALEQAGSSSAVVSASIISNVPNALITGGSYSIHQGDIHHHQHHHHHRHYHNDNQESKSANSAIWRALRAVPNFRSVYLDMLSKATEGTGMWLLKDEKFRIWLGANGDIKIFWGSGIPGAGKTVLASIVIKHLESLRPEPSGPICVCYFYFRYSDNKDLTLQSVLETLLKQTLERHPDLLGLIEQDYMRHIREGTQPSEAQLVGYLQRFSQKIGATFYVLDALDEAPPIVQSAIIRTLSSLNVKLFLTSRSLETVQRAFPQAHIFSIEAHAEDIELHINKGISDSPGLLNLVDQEGSDLRARIMTHVMEKSNGMFLHASLQMDALRSCISPHQVNRVLQDFPSRIEDAYLQTWQRILDEDQENVSLSKMVFLWVVNASRSITLEELERAVATSPQTFEFEADRVVPGATFMTMCRGLLALEKESRVVRLIHYTAKDFLQRSLHESFPHPHPLLADICITHLIKCGFQDTGIASEEEFETALEEDPLLAYSSEAWAFHSLQSLSIGLAIERVTLFVENSRAFPAFTNPHHTGYFDILSPLHIIAVHQLPLNLIDDIGQSCNALTRLHQQSPLMLASKFAYQSLCELLLASPGILVNLVDASGFSALMYTNHSDRVNITSLLLLQPGIDVNLIDIHGHSALMTATFMGQEINAMALLAHPDIQVNLVNRDGHSALMLAADQGDEGIATALLAHPDIQVNPTTKDGFSPLILAALHGHEGIIKALLAHPSIDINLVDKNGYSALMAAAHNDRKGSVIALLSHPAVQVNLVNHGGDSALMVAASYGHEESAKVLLAHANTQVNIVTKDGFSALILAALDGHDGVIKALLAHPGVDVNWVHGDGHSALMVAAHGGHSNSVSALLSHPDIQVNLVDQDGTSPLMLAAGSGCRDSVTVLLAHPDIQVNLVNKKGYSALMRAARRGHESVVSLILTHPHTNVTLSDKYGWSALLMAVERGHVGVIKTLLDTNKFDINYACPHGTTALLLAAQLGRESIVRLFLDVPGIDCTGKDNDGDTAMSLALEEGHAGIVDLLKEFEARRSAPLGPIRAQEMLPERGAVAGVSVSDIERPPTPHPGSRCGLSRSRSCCLVQ